jgi:hypothetical protein
MKKVERDLNKEEEEKEIMNTIDSIYSEIHHEHHGS